MTPQEEVFIDLINQYIEEKRDLNDEEIHVLADMHESYLKSHGDLAQAVYSHKAFKLGMILAVKILKGIK